MVDAVAAAVFAGGVAVGVTVLVERLGGRLGGLLGTLPSTIVPASLGIYSQTDGLSFVEAMDLVPAGMMLNVLFLFAWRILPPKLPELALLPTLALMTLLSLSLWCVGAVCLVVLGDLWRDFGYPTLMWAIIPTVIMAAFGIATTRTPQAAPKGKVRVGAKVLICRGGFAALAIGACVWIASFGNPLAAGVFSVFPAIFLTTMVSVWLSQGRSVQAGAVGPMMLGSLSVAVYALVARSTMPDMGAAVGCAVAWTASVLPTTVPSWLWLSRKGV